MADFVFNNAKGKVGYYATLPAAADGLIIVPLETSGIITDAAMKDLVDLATLLAGTTNEQTTMGRKTAASVTSAADNVNDWLNSDFADPVWTAAGGNAISKLVVCYDPDTGAGTDADLILLTAHDFVITPSGADVTGQVFSTGFYRAT